MRVLILAEYDASGIRSATLSAITAARQLGDHVTLLVVGASIGQITEQSRGIAGIDHVLAVENATFEHMLAENVVQVLRGVAEDFDTIIAAATTLGKNVLPRLAALLDIQQISDVITIESPTCFIRPIYAGNALQTVETFQPRNVLTIRATGFAPAQVVGDVQASIEHRQIALSSIQTRFVSHEGAVSERPDLSSAKIVVSGGRGVGSKENFRIIEELADDLHAAIGASRAAVDAGYVPNDYQVGQTGKIIAPDLYIAIGISGAIQHLAGMVGSKVVVAINKDADAPIFQVADYGLVGDLFELLPKLREELKRPKT